MDTPATPELAAELAKRIRLVRRDMGDLLFHFTRAPTGPYVEIEHFGSTETVTASTFAILRKILHDRKLIGSSKWTEGSTCVCFTEAPIQEFNSIFRLVEIAASRQERPRYEPYGIAVGKKWLYAQGGRPVIYDHPSAFASFPSEHQYRFVPYDPANGIDYTWEREWRVNCDALTLDPNETLVIVPTSDEAFDIVYELADLEADWDDEQPVGVYHKPKWLAVSLDLLGFTLNTNDNDG